MPEIPLGRSAKKRRSLWTPTVNIVNLLVEQSVTKQLNGVDHIQRPGLVLFSEVGDGPIRGVYRQAGTFDGDFLTVSGDEWYRVDANGDATLLGETPGSLRTTTAATATRAVMVSDGVAYSTNGTTVVEVNMPDSRPVGSVAQLNGYFLLTDATPGSARVYYMEPGEVDPDGLGFFSTESVPGNNVKIERVGDELWIFKAEGTEVHVPTGDADLPFQRVPGRNYDRGCLNADSTSRFDNTVAWVGDDRVVYRGDSAPLRISDHSVEEQIRKADPASLRSWSFAADGHRLFVLVMNTGTWAYDVSTQQWSEFQSYDRQTWRAHIGDEGEDFTVAGDDQEGILYRLDSDCANDNGAPMLRLITGGVAVNGEPQRCDSLEVYTVTGTITDPNFYPKGRIRWSDDLEVYSDFFDVELRRQGRYGKPVRLNRLGSMRYPGRLFEFSVTDDVVVTISGMLYNEPSR